MIGCERGIGRPSRQTNRATTEICDIELVVISLQNSANVSDVMGEARQDEIRIIACGSRPQHLSSHQDVVPGEGNQHRVLNVVIQGVAVADAIQGQSGRERKNFSQAGM